MAASLVERVRKGRAKGETELGSTAGSGCSSAPSGVGWSLQVRALHLLGDQREAEVGARAK